jgi:SAM-dependent methyltransferase
LLDSVGSTSWHNRHLDCFHRLNLLLLEEGTARRTVMVIGPGGVCLGLHALLNDSANQKAPQIRKLIGDAARYSDQVLRRIPFMPLESLEPVELSKSLSVPHDMIVIDRSSRILAAVARRLPESRRFLLDVQQKAPPEQADVVVAFNIICRLDDPEQGIRHVAAAVRTGGYLLIDDRSAAAHLEPLGGFTNVAPKIHRRQPAQVT